MITSFEPIIDKNCKILVLGTMPSVKSLEKQQYYGNKQNQFWKIIYVSVNISSQNLSGNSEWQVRHIDI